MSRRKNRKKKSPVKLAPVAVVVPDHGPKERVPYVAHDGRRYCWWSKGDAFFGDAFSFDGKDWHVMVIEAYRAAVRARTLMEARA